MKIIFLILTLLVSQSVDAQGKPNFDSLTTRLCESFKATSNLPDSERISETFKLHSSLFDNMSEKELNDNYSVLYLKLQMSCPDFDRVSEIDNQEVSDGQTIKDDMLTMLNASQCSQLLKTNKYYYLEGNSRVNLFITDSTWTSLFSDGTYSQLSLTKTSPCEFVVTYLESNNYVVLNSLKKGCQFRYKVIDDKGEYYTLISEYIPTKKMQLFRLYR